jgi:hypothetical protein
VSQFFVNDRDRQDWFFMAMTLIVFSILGMVLPILVGRVLGSEGVILGVLAGLIIALLVIRLVGNRMSRLQRPFLLAALGFGLAVGATFALPLVGIAPPILQRPVFGVS